MTEVNPICANADRQVKKAIKRLRPSGDAFADKLRAGAAFNKILGKTIPRIEAVEPPPADAAAVEDWLSGLRLQKQLFDRYVAAVKRGQVKRARAALKRGARVANENTKAAERLDLPKCT